MVCFENDVICKAHQTLRRIKWDKSQRWVCQSGRLYYLTVIGSLSRLYFVLCFGVDRRWHWVGVSGSFVCLTLNSQQLSRPWSALFPLPQPMESLRSCSVACATWRWWLQVQSDILTNLKVQELTRQLIIMNLVEVKHSRQNICYSHSSSSI